jgi:hypothetical protein
LAQMTARLQGLPDKRRRDANDAKAAILAGS